MKSASSLDCRFLSVSETAAYEEAVRACYVEDKGLTGENARKELAYRMQIFGYDNLKHFVLYDGQKPVGISIIGIDDDKNFTLQNIHLLSGYRKQGLGCFLYQTPMAYVRDHFSEGVVTARVHFKNAASIRLVEEQGFKADEKQEDGYITFRCRISDGPT